MSRPTTSTVRRLLAAAAGAGLALLAGCSAQPTHPCDAACAALARRESYVADHPELSDRIKAAIREGRVVVGMTKEDVIAAIGAPDNAVDVHAAWIEREQWVYAERRAAAGLYFFRFGKLHAWAPAAD